MRDIRSLGNPDLDFCVLQGSNNVCKGRLKPKHHRGHHNLIGLPDPPKQS